MGSVVEAIVDETAAVALDIYTENITRIYNAARKWYGLDTTHCTSEFALFHSPERFGDRVADFDAALFEFFSGSPQPRVLFDARGELETESAKIQLPW
jgi:hypothetical protein